MGIPPGIRLESAKTPCLYGALIMCHHSYDYEFPIVQFVLRCLERRRRETNQQFIWREASFKCDGRIFLLRSHAAAKLLILVIFGIGFTSSFEEEVNYVVQINTWTVCVSMCIENFRVSTNLLDKTLLLLGMVNIDDLFFQKNYFVLSNCTHTFKLLLHLMHSLAEF